MGGRDQETHRQMRITQCESTLKEWEIDLGGDVRAENLTKKNYAQLQSRYHLVCIREESKFGGRAVIQSDLCFSKVTRGKSQDRSQGKDPISECITCPLQRSFPKPFNNGLYTLILKMTFWFTHKQQRDYPIFLADTCLSIPCPNTTLSRSLIVSRQGTESYIVTESGYQVNGGQDAAR